MIPCPPESGRAVDNQEMGFRLLKNIIFGRRERIRKVIVVGSGNLEICLGHNEAIEP